MAILGSGVKIDVGLQMSNLFMPYYYGRSKGLQSKNLYAQLSAYGLIGAATTPNSVHTEFRVLQNWLNMKPQKTNEMQNNTKVMYCSHI